MSGSCNANLSSPTGIAATDGTVSYGINISWGAVSGASSYTLEQRKQGGSWSTLTTVSGTSYSWTGLNDESIYEFRVTAKNPVGSSSVSGTDTGYIRKIIDPKFVSQTVPEKVGTGQGFSVIQTWKNDGAETWTANGVYGTLPYNPSDTSVWSKGFNAFTAAAATGANTVSTINLTAPTTPGTYDFQRIFGKSSTAHGSPSPLAKILVLGDPVCTSASVDKTVVYLPSDVVKVTLSGVDQAEAAWIKVWSVKDGQDDIKTYQATKKSGSVWEASFSVSDHNDFGSIKIDAVVDNDVKPEKTCASLEVSYPDLPVPELSLSATLGTFPVPGKEGFVVEKPSGVFAQAVVSGVTLPVRIDILNDDGEAVGTAFQNVAAGESKALTFNPSGKAWEEHSGLIRVRYSDSGPAGQGKEKIAPVVWRLQPLDPGVSLSFSTHQPIVVEVKFAAGYEPSSSGVFESALEHGASIYAPYQASTVFAALDYGDFYNKKLIGAAKAVPPSDVALLRDIIYRSAETSIPLMPPASVDASDGLYEDEVRITWPAVLPNVPFRYKIYRDGVDITGSIGIAETSFVDADPKRGVIHVYGIATRLDVKQSEDTQKDEGHIPACRAARLKGAWLTADMSAMTGLIERWGCLSSMEATASHDGGDSAPLELSGQPDHLYFSYPLPAEMAEGNHVLRIDMHSEEVNLFADRYYEIPFKLERNRIDVQEMRIIYNDRVAKDGLTADSIGRFGVEITGGDGIGFAEPVE